MLVSVNKEIPTSNHSTNNTTPIDRMRTPIPTPLADHNKDHACESKETPEENKK